MKHVVLVTFAEDDILFHSENYKHILFLESVMWDTKAGVILLPHREPSLDDFGHPAKAEPKGRNCSNITSLICLIKSYLIKTNIWRQTVEDLKSVH